MTQQQHRFGVRAGLSARRAGTWLSVALVAVTAPGAARSAVQLPGRAQVEPASPAAPRHSWAPERGFFDDALAVDPTGRWLAVLRTDSASFAQIEVRDLESGRVELVIPAGSPQQLFDRIVFTGQPAGQPTGTGRALVLVTRDAARGTRTALRFDDAGRPAGTLGPAARIDFAWRESRHYLVARSPAPGKKGAATQVVTVHDLADGQPVGKPRAFVAAGDGLVKLPPSSSGSPPAVLRPLAWLDGGAQLFGLQPGGYDRARDVRVPDRAALHDVLRGETLWSAEIDDVLAWAAAARLRARDPDRAAFLDAAEDQASLRLVDGLGRAAPLSLAEPFENYDPRSLVAHEDARRGLLVFSLQLDPLNPRALARKKAEPARLDLYAVPLPTLGVPPRPEPLPARLLLRASADERPVRWAAGPGVVVLLRKFKAFARGGDVLEVYAAPDAFAAPR